MTFQEIDKLIDIKTNKTFYNTERRDYTKLENEKPELFKGYGNRLGLMYLSAVMDEPTNDHYVDINITNKVTLSFRKDDSYLIRVKTDFDNLKSNLDIFIKLISEYVDVLIRFNNFNSGLIPIDLIREYKISKIIEKYE